MYFAKNLQIVDKPDLIDQDAIEAGLSFLDIASCSIQFSLLEKLFNLV